ncbi:Adipose-regulatory protein and Protein of unknown function DUF766 domain containing protein [Aphelenchoides fujianensis]|nr:Adipose-regulatory protein and Protein of unknown function DUF766 domain containing protein [Aphelenchoides fujianensis]
MQILRELSKNLRLVREHSELNIFSVLLIAFQLLSIACFSFVTPFILRGLVSSPLVESTQPLEFVFHTCTDKLHGICSFPEATVVFEERDFELEGGYHYTFTLNVEFLDVEAAREAGVFVSQLDVQDMKGHTIMLLKKTVRVPAAGLYGWYIWARNWFFWPLYIVGLIGDGGLSCVQVEFPSEYRETFSRPARFLVVQIQNRFIQIAQSSLRIRANVGLLTSIMNNYPVTTYLCMSAACLIVFLSVFALYWATQGLVLYQKISENERYKKKARNKLHQS